jgi:hypothetical protein
MRLKINTRQILLDAKLEPCLSPIYLGLSLGTTRPSIQDFTPLLSRIESWSGGDINKKGTCLEAWETTCKPKYEGGLGIINMKTQNSVLLIKFLDKFYNHAGIP